MNSFEILNTEITANLVAGTTGEMTQLDAIDKMDIGSKIFTRMGNTSDTDWTPESGEQNCVILKKSQNMFGNSVLVYCVERNLICMGSVPHNFKKEDGTIGIGLYSTSALPVDHVAARNYIGHDELAIINQHRN